MDDCFTVSFVVDIEWQCDAFSFCLLTSMEVILTQN